MTSSSPSLPSLGEFGLIERIRRLLPRPGSDWPVGIGDDAAVFKLSPRHYQLFTEDLLIEGVHFRAGVAADWEDLGWKSLAVNLSDLAAMGGKPLGAMLGLALPKQIRWSQVEAFSRGLAAAARRYACPVVGGDTSASPSGTTVAVALLGECRRTPLLRSGARPGDGLWVTGELGASALGWIAAQRRLRGAASAFRRRHARPEPRLAWGLELAASGMVGAALDLSDGLAGDLPHLATASRVGFSVDLELLPRARGFAPLCRKWGLSEERLLVAGGEDYELLFTVRAAQEGRFRNFCRSRGLRATRIGAAEKKLGLRWHRFGKRARMAWQGYRHF